MKTAFLTGATGDIGRANVGALIAAGYRVAATDLGTSGIAALADDFGEENVLPLVCDITETRSVQDAVAFALGRFGTIDLLVNGAGGISAPSLRTTREEDWARDLDLNLTGHWRCMNALREPMIENGGGTIVNIASVNGLGIFGHPGYSVAKAGLIHLTKFAAVELGKYDIRSVAICPGSVRTQAWEDRAAAQPEILDEITSWYPSRAICTPTDVAAAVVYAASDAARLLNGAAIALDGGLASGTDRVASLFTGTTI